MVKLRRDSCGACFQFFELAKNVAVLMVNKALHLAPRLERLLNFAHDSLSDLAREHRSSHVKDLACKCLGHAGRDQFGPIDIEVLLPAAHRKSLQYLPVGRHHVGGE